MEIYRFGDEPFPVLIGHGKPEICPIQMSNEPVSGYSIKIDTHFIVLSFDEGIVRKGRSVMTNDAREKPCFYCGCQPRVPGEGFCALCLAFDAQYQTMAQRMEREAQELEEWRESLPKV